MPTKPKTKINTEKMFYLRSLELLISSAQKASDYNRDKKNERGMKLFDAIEVEVEKVREDSYKSLTPEEIDVILGNSRQPEDSSGPPKRTKK